MSSLFHKSRGFTKTWTRIWFAGPRGFDYSMLRYVCKVHKPMDAPTNDLCFVTKGLGDVAKQNIYDVNTCVSCTWNVCFSIVLNDLHYNSEIFRCTRQSIEDPFWLFSVVFFCIIRFHTCADLLGTPMHTTAHRGFILFVFSWFLKWFAL